MIHTTAMKHFCTALLSSALLLGIAASASAAPGAKPAAAPQPAQGPESLADWWAREMDALNGAEGLFYSGKVVVQNRPADDQLFALAEIKGAIYGPRGAGTVIYAGSAWTVGESRDISGRKVLFEELSRPDDTQPGKARFTVGTASREVTIEETSSNTNRLLVVHGWVTGDGSVVAVPVSGQKVGGRAWVTLNGLRRSAKVTQLEGSWTYLTVARDDILPIPAVAAPALDDPVTLVTTEGKAFVAPYRVLTLPSPVPPVFAGAVVIASDGSLVGFIGAEEGFAPATGGGAGRFAPSDRRVECSIEQQARIAL